MIPNNYSPSPNGDSQPKLSVHLIMGVAQDYFEMFESFYLDGWVADIKHLPHPKAIIEQALTHIIHKLSDPEAIEEFTLALLRIANWQPGVGDNPILIKQTRWDKVVEAEKDQLHKRLLTWEGERE